MISDMAQNNPAALQVLQKEFGAGGTTSGENLELVILKVLMYC